MVSKSMGYNLLINGVHWGYNPFTNHLLNFWDIQAVVQKHFLMEDFNQPVVTFQPVELPKEVKEFLTHQQRIHTVASSWMIIITTPLKTNMSPKK